MPNCASLSASPLSEMLAEAQTVVSMPSKTDRCATPMVSVHNFVTINSSSDSVQNSVDECNKMQTLSSRKLPELIESFELKLNQQKDVAHVKLKAGKPVAKMKLRDLQEVLEIARLKVMVSEMRERTNKMEGQLKSAAEKKSQERGNTDITGLNRMQGKENKVSELYNAEDKIHMKSEQECILDKEVSQQQACIGTLQFDIKAMLLELSCSPDLQEELSMTNKRIKDMQNEIKDDASTTKAQLLLLKQQFGELEKANNVSKQKELAFQKVSELLNTLQAETEELKKNNYDLRTQKQEISQKLKDAVEKVEKITSVTEDDLLASRTEVLKLRSTNVELQKKMEKLQMSRFNEVEEVVYMRWVNACLRHELDVYKWSDGTSDEISSQVENCSPAGHGKDDSNLFGGSNHSVEQYCHDRGKSEEQVENCLPCPQRSSQLSSAYSSPSSTSFKQNGIQVSPLVIPNGNVSSKKTSPLASPSGQVEGSQSSNAAGPLELKNVSPASMVNNARGFPKSSHAFPHNTVQDESRPNAGSSDPIGQRQPSDQHNSHVSGDLKPQHNSPSLQSGLENAASIQAGLTINGNQPSKLDVTSYITSLPRSSPRRLGRNFARSSSTLSAGSEGSIQQAQGSPLVQDRRACRSSRALFANSDINDANHILHGNSLSRRHSASVVAEPSKREDDTVAKAHSFDSHLDASDRVVTAFRRLSVSTQTSHTHRSFKEISRQNSLNENGESELQQSGRHDFQTSPARSTKTDFVCDLARAVEATHYNSIEQVSAFVDWFDRQGDTEKQEFYQFPDFPRNKVEAMRRAAYEYHELQSLENELRAFKDKPNNCVDTTILDMETLLEKVENHIQAFKQARHLAILQFGEHGIPTNWMLDSGKIAKVKQAAFELAQMYINQVLKILIPKSEHIQESRDALLLNSAKFLLQVHNFTGGFDEKTANAFAELQRHTDIQSDKVTCCSALS